MLIFTYLLWQLQLSKYCRELFLQTCLFLFLLKKNQANTLSFMLAKLQKIEFAPNKVYSNAILKYLQGDNQQKAIPVKCILRISGFVEDLY